jgi:imidazolonepropionase-like amidohydrolase
MIRSIATPGRRLLAVALLLPCVARAQEGTWALTNARIQTVSKGVIEKGTIVIRDGLIVAVGADVAVPADARVFDLTNRTVQPGLIDLTSTIGLPAPAAPQGGGRGGGGGGAPAAAAGPTFNGFDAERVIADEIHITPADARAARESGVTAALVSPSRGALRGLSALMPMKDSASASSVLRSPVAEHFGFQGAGGFGGPPGIPGTIMGVIAFQRQSLYDARLHGIVEDRWRADPKGLRRPDNDAKLDALVPVVRGTMPLFYDANNEDEIRRALRIDKEFDIKFTIVGATEGWRALDALAGHQVVVSTNFPNATQATGWQYFNATRHGAADSAVADREARKAIEANAAAINKAGIKFALASGGRTGTEFVANVKKAIAAGLPADVALQAVTIRAAEIAGLDKALGSIEVGKIANLVVTEGGGILSDSSHVRAVFVDGDRFEVAAPAPAARAAGGGGPGGGRGGGGGQAGPDAAAAVMQIGGAWRLAIESPQGTQQVTMTVNQSGAGFTGRMSGLPTGDVDISDGKITGNKATWSLTLSFGGQSLALNFSGDVTGTKIAGTVELGPMGSATFSGDKTP